MNAKVIIDRVLEKGFDEAEVFYMKSNSLKFEVFESKVDSYSLSEHQGYSLRMIVNNKLGYAYSEDTDEQSIDNLIENCIQNAKCSDKETNLELTHPQEYENVQTYYSQLAEVSYQEKRDCIVEFEKKLKQSDSRISKVMLKYGETKSEIQICNTKNLDIKSHQNMGYILTQIVAVENGQSVVDYEVKPLFEFKRDDILNEVAYISKNIIDKLSPSRIPSGHYPCIIKNTAFANLLSTMTSIFSLDFVNKDLSVLKQSLNQQVFNNKISMIDNPHLNRGVKTCNFDSEGNKTHVKKLVSNGVLKMFINDQKSANEANVKPTGNGFKGAYNSKVSVQMTNFYIEAANQSLDEMISKIDEGVLIDNFGGLHAGVNSLTTEFSLQSSGFYIKNGKIEKPISLITIAGNFIELLNQVEMVGDDLKFDLSIGSPSIYFKSVAVSGE